MAVASVSTITAASPDSWQDATEIGFEVPLVVRLEGTNVEAGRKILEEGSAKLTTLQAATDLGDAAKKVAAAVA